MVTNPNLTNATENNEFPKVTTESLGIATERGRDLAGIVLRPDEITTAVCKYLMFFGIEDTDIYSVKVGVDKDASLRIIAEINKKALSPKKAKISWMTFEDGGTDETLIPNSLYSAWHNKLYHGKKKHLRTSVVVRGKDDKFKCIAINIDPAIFLAFAYDIKFDDRMYKISAVPERWKSEKQLDDMSGKERHRYKAHQRECSSYGIVPCKMVVLTFSNREDFKFHPNQVDNFYSTND